MNCKQNIEMRVYPPHLGRPGEGESLYNQDKALKLSAQFLEKI